MVCVQAGNVNTGAFDPTNEMVRSRIRQMPGCMSMELLVYGLPHRPNERTWPLALVTQTPGQRTATSGSTFRMIQG